MLRRCRTAWLLWALCLCLGMLTHCLAYQLQCLVALLAALLSDVGVPLPAAAAGRRGAASEWLQVWDLTQPFQLRPHVNNAGFLRWWRRRHCVPWHGRGESWM